MSKFYDIETVDLEKILEIDAKEKLVGGVLLDDIKESEGEDLLFTALSEIKDSTVKALYNAGLKTVDVITKIKDPLMLETIRQEMKEYDAISSDEIALYIYSRLRPSTPSNLERAKE